jgi:hypothetical protein
LCFSAQARDGGEKKERTTTEPNEKVGIKLTPGAINILDIDSQI